MESDDPSSSDFSYCITGLLIGNHLLPEKCCRKSHGTKECSENHNNSRRRAHGGKSLFSRVLRCTSRFLLGGGR